MGVKYARNKKKEKKKVCENEKMNTWWNKETGSCRSYTVANGS